MQKSKRYEYITVKCYLYDTVNITIWMMGDGRCGMGIPARLALPAELMPTFRATREHREGPHAEHANQGESSSHHHMGFGGFLFPSYLSSLDIRYYLFYEMMSLICTLSSLCNSTCFFITSYKTQGKHPHIVHSIDSTLLCSTHTPQRRKCSINDDTIFFFYSSLTS